MHSGSLYLITLSLICYRVVIDISFNITNMTSGRDEESRPIDIVDTINFQDGGTVEI